MVLFLSVFLFLFVQRAICRPWGEGAFSFSEIGSWGKKGKKLYCLLLSLLKMICWNWSLTQLQDILSLTSRIQKCFWPPPIPSPAQHTCTTDLKMHTVWTSVQKYQADSVEWCVAVYCTLWLFSSHQRFVHNHVEPKGTSESKESIWLAWLSTLVVGVQGLGCEHMAYYSAREINGSDCISPVTGDQRM